MNGEEAVTENLRMAQDLKMFGVKYFEAQDKIGTDLWLGVEAPEVISCLRKRTG